MSLTNTEVLAIYARVLDHAKTHKDSKGNGNEDPELVAFNGVRTEVHAALELKHPQPVEHDDDEGDPELHHARQKSHNKKLWKRADKIVADAGITAKGVKS